MEMVGEKTIAQALTLDQPVMLLRTPSPITPGNYLLEFAMRHLTQIRDFAPLGERELFNLLWDLIVLLQAGPVEKHGTRNGTHRIERGEKVGILIWYISPPVHRLMPESTACPGSMYGVHKQASFLKLSTPVSSALGGHVLFPTGTHIGALTKFTQQGFGDSQQGLSLLNTKSSLIMRKAVLQFKILVGKWENLLILWPPKTSNVDLFPSLLNLSPTKLE